MEKISLKTVLDVVSEEIWWKTCAKNGSETGTMTPSLQERMALVEQLRHTAQLRRNTVYLNGSGPRAEHIHFYNYLLLEREVVPTGDQAHTLNWSISGFWRFEELENYVKSSTRLFTAVFVKVEPAPCSHYEKAFCKFFKTLLLSGKRIPISAHSFFEACRYGKDMPCLENFSLSIEGLCEFSCEAGVSCHFTDSLEGLRTILDDRAYSYIFPNREEGSVRYDGTLYFYEIDTDKKEDNCLLYNARLEPYCTSISNFCPLEGSACRVCTGLG